MSYIVTCFGEARGAQKFKRAEDGNVASKDDILLLIIAMPPKYFSDSNNFPINAYTKLS